MTRPPPDWSLIKEIVRRVDAAPCGGMHRAELAAAFGLPAYCPSMRAALGIAWQHRQIDSHCWRFSCVGCGLGVGLRYQREYGRC